VAGPLATSARAPNQPDSVAIAPGFFGTGEGTFERNPGWCFNHLEKYESQWEGLSHILWKIKNV